MSRTSKYEGIKWTLVEASSDRWQPWRYAAYAFAAALLFLWCLK